MKRREQILSALIFSLCFTCSGFANEENALVEISLEIPEVDVSPYFRPYVAVWLETDRRQPVATLALWYQEGETMDGGSSGDIWLKDLRQWWRKSGSASSDGQLDAVTGATRKPGVYTIFWDGNDNFGNPVEAGDYLLNFEASREEGGRGYYRQAITLNEEGNFSLQGDVEFGEITISTKAR